MANVIIYLAVILCASAVVTGIVALLTWLWPSPRRVVDLALDPLGEPRSFAFKDGYLVSSERGAGFLLPRPINRLAAWDDMVEALSSLVVGAEEALEALAQTGRAFHLEGRMGRDRLHLIGLRDGEELRVTLATADQGQEAIRVNAPILAALESENRLLTQSHNASPSLAWVLDEEGRVIWANGPYLDEVLRCLGPDAGAAWPIPTLFPDQAAAPSGPHRRSLGGKTQGQSERWYEVVVCDLEDGVRHAHAQPLGRIIAAEESLRTFINTLTRTFTALPTGLAIFDADRKLVLFNPPLLDMTGLDGAWLAGRPHLSEVLDTMREKQRLPEPRDWRVWRDALISAGRNQSDEPWHETWTLPGGQSFRITARPQSDGAVAILLEDVTAEMALARRRRSDSDVLAALLDTSGDAIAAYGPDGSALHLNNQMLGLAGLDQDSPQDLNTLITRLSARSEPTSVWGDLRDLGRSPEPRGDWTEPLTLKDGRRMLMHILPLSEGRVALRLTEAEAEAPKIVAPNAEDRRDMRETAGLLASAASAKIEMGRRSGIR